MRSLELKVDFAVVAVLAQERSALLDEFSRRGTVDPAVAAPFLHHKVCLSESFSDKRHSPVHGIVAATKDIGRIKAAVVTSQIVTRYTPKCIVLAGVAGGVKDQGVSLGDLVIATEIADYEQQKWTQGGDVQVRWQRYPASPRMIQIARLVNSKWGSFIHNELNSKSDPKAHFGLVLSGDKIFADSDALAPYVSEQPTAVGVEMEGAGVAGVLSDYGLDDRFLMVRGVADLADKRKTSDMEKWTNPACNLAAAYTVAFIGRFFASQNEDS
jgi:nucleoside phosphorylase